MEGAVVGMTCGGRVVEAGCSGVFHGAGSSRVALGTGTSLEQTSEQPEPDGHSFPTVSQSAAGKQPATESSLRVLKTGSSRASNQ